MTTRRRRREKRELRRAQEAAAKLADVQAIRRAAVPRCVADGCTVLFPGHKVEIDGVAYWCCKKHADAVRVQQQRNDAAAREAARKELLQ